MFLAHPDSTISTAGPTRLRFPLRLTLIKEADLQVLMIFLMEKALLSNRDKPDYGMLFPLFPQRYFGQIA
jgi:hypothetical protein